MNMKKAAGAAVKRMDDKDAQRLADMAQALKQQRAAKASAQGAAPKISSAVPNVPIRSAVSSVMLPAIPATKGVQPVRQPAVPFTPQQFTDFNSAAEYVDYLNANLPQNRNGNAVSLAIDDAIKRYKSNSGWWNTAAEMEQINAQYAPGEEVYSPEQIDVARLTEQNPAYLASLEQLYTEQIGREERARKDKAIARYERVKKNDDYTKFVEAGKSGKKPELSFEDFYNTAWTGNAAEEYEKIVDNPAQWARENAAHLIEIDRTEQRGQTKKMQEQGLANPLYLYMSDEQYDIYSYYIGKGDREQADKYFESIESDLREERNREQYQTYTEWAAAHPGAAFFTSAIDRVASVPGLLQGVAQAAINSSFLGDGIDRPLDINSDALGPSRRSDAYDAGVLSNIKSPFLQSAYGIATSIRDNAVAGAVGLLLGPEAAAALLAAESTTNAMYQAGKEGLSAEDATTVGAINGIWEYLTEKFAFDELFDVFKRSGKNLDANSIRNILRRQTGIEASEEYSNSILSTVTEIELLGGNSQYERYVAKLKDNGASHREAVREANKEFFWKQPLEAAVAGAVAGGFMSYVGVGTQAAVDRATKNNRQTTSAPTTEQAAASTLAGITQRKQSGGSTIADTVAEKVLTGQTPSNSEIRQLQNATTTIQRSFEGMTGIEVVGVDSSNLRASIAAAVKTPAITIEQAAQHADAVVQAQAAAPAPQYDSLRYNAPDASAIGAIDAARQGGAPFEVASAQDTGSAAGIADDFRQKQVAQRKPTEASAETDTAGNRLSAAQAEHFKDSKARNRDGKLIPMYHGSPADFTVFDIGKSRNGYLSFGFYFTSNREYAEEYQYKKDGNGGKMVKSYLNITNPCIAEAPIDKARWKQVYERVGLDSSWLDSVSEKADNSFAAYHLKTVDGAERVTPEMWREAMKSVGWDGWISNGSDGLMAVAFDSAQIKRTDNRAPTESDDIRFRLTRDQYNATALFDALEFEELSNAKLANLTAQLRERLGDEYTISDVPDARELLAAVEVLDTMDPGFVLNITEKVYKTAEQKAAEKAAREKAAADRAERKRLADEEKQRKAEAAEQERQRKAAEAEEKKAAAAERRAKAAQKRATAEAARTERQTQSSITKAVKENIVSTERIKGSGKTANSVQLVNVDGVIRSLDGNARAEFERAADSVREFGRAFGHRVRFFTGRMTGVDGDVFGFYHNEEIYVNVNNLRAAGLKTVAHEICHDIAAQDSSFASTFYRLYREYCESNGLMNEFSRRWNNVYNNSIYPNKQLAIAEEVLAEMFGERAEGDSEFLDYCLGKRPGIITRIVESLNRILTKLHLKKYSKASADAMELRNFLLGSAARYQMSQTGKDMKLSAGIRSDYRSALRKAEAIGDRYAILDDLGVNLAEWDTTGLAAPSEYRNLNRRAPDEATNYGFKLVVANRKAHRVLIVNPSRYVPDKGVHADMVASSRSLAAALGFRLGFISGKTSETVGEGKNRRDIVTDMDFLLADDGGTVFINLDSEIPYTKIVAGAWWSRFRKTNPTAAANLERLSERVNKLTGGDSIAQNYAVDLLTRKGSSGIKALTMDSDRLVSALSDSESAAYAYAHERPGIIRKLFENAGDMVARLTKKQDYRAAYISGQLQARLMKAFTETTPNRPGGDKIETVKRKSVPEGMRFMSIQTLEDGTRYVEVDIEQERFMSLTPKEMQNQAKRVILDKFKGKVIGQGERRAYVNKRSAEEYAYPAKYLDDETKESKMRASTELDNLMEVSVFLGHNNDDGRHEEAVNGWRRYSTIFKVGARFWKGEISVMGTERGWVFYDLTKIKDITEGISDLQGEKPSVASDGNVSINTIPHPTDEVKFSARRSSEASSSESTRNPTDPVDTYKRRDLRSKISKEVKALSAALTSPSDKKHIPPKLTAAIADFLKEFTNDTSVFTAAKLAVLRDAYDRLSDTGVDSDMDVSYAYDPDISETISELSDTIDGRRLAQLNMDETIKVRNIVQHFKHLVTAENKLFLEGRKRDVAALGSDIMTELRQHPAARNKADQGTFKAFTDMLTSGNITPAYFFKRIGGTMESLFKSMRSGQNVWATNMRQAQQTYESIFKKHHADKWLNKRNDTLTFTTERGDNITLTRQQALTLYATHQREVTNQIQEAGHLSLGGFVYEDAVKTKRGEESVDTTKAHPLNANDMRRIIDWLTDEQIQFADELVGYMSGDLAKLGNETSLKLHGWEKFTESYYFPYNSAENYLYTKQAVTEDRRLKHMSFTKSTVRKANNPIVLSDFTQVWANHVQNMLMYSSLAVPLEDFNRVYNYKTSVTEDSTSRSVKEALEKAYGKNANAYIKQLMTDINGGVTPPRSEGFFNRMMSKFRKSAVFASASVVVQQPSAIGRAMAMIDPKYFVASTFQRKSWEECKRWCGVALIKEMGRFDTSTGRGAADWLIARPYRGAQKVGAFFTDGDFRDDVLSAPAAKADAYTWSAIWNACKREAVREKGLQPNSEELFKAAAERFDEVINFTQVYDSVFARSELMRSKSGLTKAMTAFMSEPTVTYNMLLDSVVNARRKDVKNKVNPARAVGAFILSATINAVLKSLVTALREEDEDKTYIEKYLGELVENFESDTNLLSLIPYVRDLLSLAKGYSVENTAYDVPKDFIEAGGDILDWIEKNIAGEATNVDIGEALLDLGDAISAGFGIPVKNIRRDISAIHNTIYSTKPLSETSKAGILDSILSKTQYYDNRKTANYGRLVDAYMSGDDEKAADIVDRLLVSGTEESSIARGTKSVVKTEYLNGRISDEEAIKLLVDHGNADADDAYWLIQEWEYNSAKGDDDPNFSKYLRLRDALDADDKAEIHDAAVELLEHGVSAKTLKSETKKHAGSSSILYQSGLADYLDEDKEKGSGEGSGGSGGRSSGGSSGGSSAKSVATTSINRGEAKDTGGDLSTVKSTSSQTLRKPTTQPGGRVNTDSPNGSTVSGDTDPTIPSAGQTGIFNAGCANNENGSCRIGRTSCENCPYATNK